MNALMIKALAFAALLIAATIFVAMQMNLDLTEGVNAITMGGAIAVAVITAAVSVKYINQMKTDVATGELADEIQLLGNMVTETGKLVVHLSERGSELERNVAETRGQLSALRNEFLGDLSATLQSMVHTLEKAA